jgi:DNA-binding transcriptional LysR family regulator
VYDAACRLSDLKPRMVFESRSVNTLLAMAEAGHGVAIIPSALRTDPKRIATRPVAHRQKPLELNLALI